MTNLTAIFYLTVNSNIYSANLKKGIDFELHEADILIIMRRNASHKIYFQVLNSSNMKKQLFRAGTQNR